jgi:pyocin large subunit-like protein
MRRLFACAALAAICAAVAAFGWDKEDAGATSRRSPTAQASAGSRNASASRTWGNPSSLPDHFTRHGGDFRARHAEDYARMAAEFLQRARSVGLPAKVDDRGVIRVFDARSGAFGAYNRDGTTKTFFKPGSDGYFDRQPGRPVDLKTWR